MKRVVAGLLVLAAIGCGRDAEEAQPESGPESGEVAQPQGPPAGPSQYTEEAYATVRVVGLDGLPLEGMEPIATAEPNAFNAPVARGPLTGEDGRSYLMLPRGKWLYVRAWDRSLGLFANNFFDIPPSEGTHTGEMEIVMVPGTKLKATLVGADGAPVAEENVGLMLFHPTYGPWWPGEADTDGNGVARFGMVPAGRFALKIKAIRSGEVDLPEMYFPPGQTLDLGVVTLGSRRGAGGTDRTDLTQSSAG